MRRKLKNLKNKSGSSQNGSPRQLIDEAIYREHSSRAASASHRTYDSVFSGWSHASRPLDMAINVRRSSGTTGATFVPPPP